MLPGDKLANYPRVIVELGMGDGRLLKTLADNDTSSLYIGIEIDVDQFLIAKSRISASNVILLNDSFEKIIPALPDESIDLFIAVLPDPAFIDDGKIGSWKTFYVQLYGKLKKGGRLQIVTELTDELLQPVKDEKYEEWTSRLLQAFLSIGYVKISAQHDAPAEYSSRCLDQFRGDPERIRLITLNFGKQEIPS